MINVSDVATGLLGLGVIAGAVCLVALGGRKDDGHTVADYRPSVKVHLTGDAEPFAAAVREVRGRLRPVDVLPPAPPGADAGSPLYVETLFRTWYPDAPDVVAGRMLREIAEESDDVIWNSTAERDMTGAFPVVAVA